MPRKKKRFALVGAGGRAMDFISPLVTQFDRDSELVGLCDTNPGRIEFHNRRLVEELNYHAVPAYSERDFDRMIKETKPDAVIVTTVDAYHDLYIIRALELGCDVVTEKPMTINDRKCRAIFDAVQRTGGNVRVAFNYRWMPGATLVKQLLSQGVIGDVLHVDMEYLLNTQHGADYFRRWHREKKNSGGLIVHKSTHHFDLVNWWIDAVPQRVVGFGRLAFYGPENARKRGVKVKYDRYTGHDTTGDPFALKIDQRNLAKLYKNNEHHDGYLRDRNVFSAGVTIEDSMSLLVQYRTGVVLNYSLNAYLPREGFHVVFNGTKGRLEYQEDHASHIIAGQGAREINREATWGNRCVVHPHFSAAYEVPVPVGDDATHGGSDTLLTEQVFSRKPPKDKWSRNAGHEQGAASILVGIAANQSFASGKIVDLPKLCPKLPKAARLSELV